MAEISAGLVKELRDRTDAPMMECKRALTEAGGDLARAEEILRIRSGARASKAAARVAAEGVIGAWLAPDAKLGALVELNCETDFVARNEAFAAFALELAQAVAKDAPPDVGGLAAFEPKRQALVQKIGENITVRRFARLQTGAKLALYVHSNQKVGVLVEFEGDDDVGKGVAMHVAFHKPAYLSRADVPSEVVAREREILSARARESAKPAQIVAKMIEGGLAKYFAETTLLGQPFVMDDKQSVEKMLAANKSRVLGYAFLVVGEGIEKKKAA
jgi:elongation factor Ts